MNMSWKPGAVTYFIAIISMIGRTSTGSLLVWHAGTVPAVSLEQDGDELLLVLDGRGQFLAAKSYE